MPLVLLENLLLSDLGLLPHYIFVESCQRQESFTARGLRISALVLIRGSFTLRHLLFLQSQVK